MKYMTNRSDNSRQCNKRDGVEIAGKDCAEVFLVVEEGNAEYFVDNAMSSELTPRFGSLQKSRKNQL